MATDITPLASIRFVGAIAFCSRLSRPFAAGRHYLGIGPYKEIQGYQGCGYIGNEDG